jgi:small subunit ribosomal protein S24e
MRFAFVLRHRRGLLMKQHSSYSSSHALSSASSLKRPHGQQALASSLAATALMNPTEAGRTTPSSSSDNVSRRPTKAPKVDTAQQYSTAAALSRSPRGRPSRSSASSGRNWPSGGGYGLAKKSAGRSTAKSSGKSKRQLPILPEPVHTKEYVRETYCLPNSTLKQSWLENAKSAASNFAVNNGTKPPRYTFEEMQGPDGGTMWRYRTCLLRGGSVDILHRATIIIEKIFADGTEDLVTYGDSATRKEAENTAALSAVYQLEARGVVSRYSFICLCHGDSLLLLYFRACPVRRLRSSIHQRPSY